MRNHRNDIKNELAYFYTIIKNMDIKDSVKNSKIKEHEFSLEEVIYDNFSDDFAFLSVVIFNCRFVNCAAKLCANTCIIFLLHEFM